MIHRRNVLTSILAVAFVGGAAAQTPAPRIPVTASFSIVADLVREVGGDRIEVSALVGPGQDAHVYQPTPADARTISQAKGIFINGLHFEEFMGRLIKTAGAKAPVFRAAAGFEPLKASGKHSHGDHKGHSHGDFAPDPHAWHSVPNVKAYVGNISKGLAQIDPDGATVYAQRAAAYIEKLDALDREIRAAVEDIPKERRIAVTTHDAFAYLAREYGIQFVTLQGVSTDTEISAAGLGKTIREVKARKAPAVFIENITDPRKIERLSKETGAKLGGTLYSDALSKADGPAPTYIELMRHNIRQLKQALAP
ncbi:MAG TPA: metal ABC transporter substrate-binding protein [Beijerinckiaceae bacterium]|nr:metal ABC transporter substrate-binding protein [Beijerinckiaceae bacterium]